MIGTNNMTNLEKLEKSRGVLIFAFPSSHVDYVKIADQTSKLIAKNLQLPITLVTSLDSTPNFKYDQILRFDPKLGNVRRLRGDQIYEWKNYDRCRAYELSPYDETLLVDTDYCVLDQTLLKLFEQPFDYRLQYAMHTPKAVNTDEMGPVSLPMVWATVVLFRKTTRAKIFFDLIAKIQRNYGYYRALYNIREGNFRNDFAFSVANTVMNGHNLSPESFIPWPMLTIENNINCIERNQNFLTVRYDTSADIIARQNLHVMDKHFLISDNFVNFVNEICNE